MSPFYVYVLQSLKDGKTYVGETNNLERRLAEHNAGRVPSTKFRRPLKVLFTEQFKTSKQAKDRELWWKSSTGRRKLKKYFQLMP
jgi:putative endonuclease